MRKNKMNMLALAALLVLLLAACAGGNAANEDNRNNNDPNNNVAVTNNGNRGEEPTEHASDFSNPATEDVSDLAPIFLVRTFGGEDITPDDMAGKVIVLNFWASWCIPCETEVPLLQAAWEIYQDRGDVLFIGLAYVDTPEATAEFIQRFGLTYPTGHEIETQVAQTFRITDVPETYIIDGAGRLVHTQTGPFTSLDELTVIVDELLGQ